MKINCMFFFLFSFFFGGGGIMTYMNKYSVGLKYWLLSLVLWFNP